MSALLRFVTTTGRYLHFEIGPNSATIRNYEPDAGQPGAPAMIAGWNDGDPAFDVHGSSFATAWEKFCGYWPEASRH